MGLLVISDGAQPLDVRARRFELGGKQQPVRLVDLSRLEPLPRSAQLTPGREDGCTRSPRRSHLRHSSRCERSHLGSPQASPRSDDDLATANVASGRTDTRAERNDLCNFDCVV